jgi:hypothetical protein
MITWASVASPLLEAYADSEGARSDFPGVSVGIDQVGGAGDTEQTTEVVLEPLINVPEIDGLHLE